MGVIASRPVTSMQVRDRSTGQLVDEKVPLYLRTVYQVMYQNPVGRFLTHRQTTQNLLRNTTATHGSKMDLPQSVRAIPKFIRLYGVDVAECELPVSEYKSFNEFFARRLKADCRPIDGKDDPSVLVSPADCRLLAYESLEETQQVWLKGNAMDLHDLLGSALEDQKVDISRLKNPAVVIARLAPNDYHRWHVPCSATVGVNVPITGQYYSVSPRAVRNTDILSSNKRTVCCMHSDQQQASKLGTWLLISVGAAMVSSINLAPAAQKVGATMQKGDEHGWFMFGGSTLVLLFDRTRVQFDSDLLENSRIAMESLVRMGEQIGTVVEVAPTAPSSPAIRTMSPYPRGRSRRSSLADAHRHNVQAYGDHLEACETGTHDDPLNPPSITHQMNGSSTSSSEVEPEGVLDTDVDDEFLHDNLLT